MLKKFSKIEKKLNQLIEKVSAPLSSFANRIFSQKQKDIVSGEAWKKRAQTAGSRFILWCKDFAQQAIARFQKITSSLSKLQQKIKEKFSRLGKKEKVALIIFYLFYPAFFLKKWFASLSPNQTLFAICSSIVVGISAFNIVISSRNIVDPPTPKRQPASAPAAKKNTRPKYYKKNLRTTVLGQYKMPIYFSNVAEIHVLDLSFSVVTSNRAAKHFLEDYDYLVKNTLIMGVEPIVPTFPLEEEGKQIIKEKVKDELDLLFERENIKGEVEEVFIVDSLGV